MSQEDQWKELKERQPGQNLRESSILEWKIEYLTRILNFGSLVMMKVLTERQTEWITRVSLTLALKSLYLTTQKERQQNDWKQLLVFLTSAPTSEYLAKSSNSDSVLMEEEEAKD